MGFLLIDIKEIPLRRYDSKAPKSDKKEIASRPLLEACYSFSLILSTLLIV